MVWDGHCGFCAYWVSRWSAMAGGKIDFRPFQEVAKEFPDIEHRHFTEASRLIETDGTIYSGPASAYRSLKWAGKWSFLDKWYRQNKFFRRFSDHLYQLVADNRNGFFRITKALFGSDPHNPRPFWVIYLVFILYLIYSFA